MLWILLDARYALTREMYERGLFGWMSVNPVFGFVAFGVSLADLAVRLPDGCDHLITIHSHNWMALGDRFLHLRRKGVDPVHRSGPFLREIQKRRKDVFQFIGREIRHTLRELEIDRTAHALL